MFLDIVLNFCTLKSNETDSDCRECETSARTPAKVLRVQNDDAKHLLRSRLNRIRRLVFESGLCFGLVCVCVCVALAHRTRGLFALPLSIAHFSLATLFTFTQLDDLAWRCARCAVRTDGQIEMHAIHSILLFCSHRPACLSLRFEHMFARVLHFRLHVRPSSIQHPI